MSGDSESRIERKESNPEVDERSEGIILQGVDRHFDNSSSLSALRASNHMQSRPSASSEWQKAVPIPEDAPVTIAILIRR